MGRPVGLGWHRRRLHWLAAAYLLIAWPCAGFLPDFWSRALTLAWDSHTHQYITERAILNVTMETLAGISRHQRGHDTQEQTGLGRAFWSAVGEVVKSNAAMDFLSTTRSDPVFHFDSERVDGATAVLRQAWSQTLLSVRATQHQSARRSLGQLFHSLQDFYSHSNWVEMGQRDIYHHLLQPEETAVPVAQEATLTCMECFSATCRGNLMPRLTQRQPHLGLLTTGYFSDNPSKPEGKCSHGGILDSSRRMGAKGGINKDSTSPLFSPHHYLHLEAARLASEATMAVLKDLRDTVGHAPFLRLFSVQQPPALVFVIDTTGSMFEEINAARLRALAIIQGRAESSAGQPGTYLLVPFHDPEVGPVYETDDPEQFMGYLEDLMALGGGDEPEMSLSAIQLALTHSPPLSEIFVFTDASPKDAHLFSSVKALTLEKQCKVTFLLTEDPSHKRAAARRRRSKRSREHLSPDRFSLYSALSAASGGLTVFTTNAQIHKVSAIVEDITVADKVTLLHVESDSGVDVHHPFRVDRAMNRVILHLTGTLRDCNLTDPSGVSQSLLAEDGPLAECQSFEGLGRVRLLPPVEPGQWHLHARTYGPFTFNIIGDSSVDFLYYFATVANETHPGLSRVEGSPIAGVPTFLVLTVKGLASNAEAYFSHVTLLAANGESLQKVWLNSSSSSSSSLSVHSYVGEELVGVVDLVPRVPFCVRLSGRDVSGNKLERVSTEMIEPTHVQIRLVSVPRLVPGHSTTVHFDVLNHGPARLFNLTAADDRGYMHPSGPHSFPVAEKGSIRGQVDLRTPPTAEAGAPLTLTLSVCALDSMDSNYAVAYLTVVPPDPDMSPPSCSTLRLERPCPSLCTNSSWTVSLAVSDRGRSGLASLQLLRGEGFLTLLPHAPTPPGEGQAGTQQQPDQEKLILKKGEHPMNVSEWVGDSSQALWVRYNAGCCAPHAELLVWDRAGNLRRCHLSSGQQGGLRAKDSETNGSGKTTIFSCSTGVLLLWACGLIWFCSL
ncbi:von Willebrand factor A domain-containing protein 7 isoform X2 [Gadus morhua]|uniref:von Willebrand factor A domain-containing protein 7 isoform X2 n=1 Tax=Gadus morhua TaxID=8049 RepID=UPI0011B6A53D|nr:von Willebrand factor A domain-containing protein 7-like isoform X2 [Gadus morhua]